jgi:DNA topoisomerase II
MWVYDEETSSFSQRKIQYVPAMLNIFDAILLNAASHKETDRLMESIEVNFDV